MACVRMIWLTALTGGWLFVQAQTATQILEPDDQNLRPAAVASLGSAQRNEYCNGWSRR
jgi:hypothetical protein